MSATYAGLSQGDLMKLTGVSITTCRNLTLKGIFVKNPDGSWDPQPSIQNYIEYLKKRHGVSGEMGGEDRDPDQEFRKQKARQARMQADQMEGRLIEIGDVALQWESHIYASKAKFLSMADKIVAEIAPLLREDVALEELRDPVKRMVDEALEELSKDPELDEDEEADADSGEDQD